MASSTTKQSRTATDQIILDLILAKRIKVKTKIGHVYYWNNKQKKWIRRKYGWDNTYRYRRVTLNYKGKRKDIMVHRIVWIAANMQLLPEGYEVHHGEKGRLCNSIDNLTALSREDHFIEHYGYPPAWDVEEF